MSQAMWHVALGASAHERRPAVSHHFRHRWMFVRVPIRWIERIVYLGLSELQLALRRAEQRTIIRAASPPFVHDGISPCWRLKRISTMDHRGNG